MNSQGLCHYPFGVNLDRCVGKSNALDEDFNKTYMIQVWMKV